MIKIKVGKKKTKGAIVVILDDQDRTLLLKRIPQAYWAPDQWAFPGGKIDDGETPLAAAIRETEEETTLEVLNLRPLAIEPPKPVEIYYTRDFTGTVQIDEEHTDWMWATREEAKDYDLAPQVLEMLDWVLENE